MFLPWKSGNFKIQVTLSKLAGDTKLGRAADTPGGCVATQRDLDRLGKWADRLGKWADRNLMEFNMEKCNVLHLGRISPTHQYMLGATRLKSSFAGKDLGVLADTRLNVSQQWALAAKKATLKVSWAALDQVLPAG